MMVFVQHEKVTANQFFKMFEESTSLIELIDGEVVMSPAPLDPHQAISMNLSILLGSYIKEHGLGELRAAPTDLKFDEDNVVQPDLFYVANSNARCRMIDGGYWEGAPDLCIEIISSSSGKRDRGKKFNLYAKYSVSEYWIIEPEARFIEVFELKEGTFQRKGLFGDNESFTSILFSDLFITAAKIFP